MDPDLKQEDEEAQMNAGFNSADAGPSDQTEPPAQPNAESQPSAGQPNTAAKSGEAAPSSSTGEAEPSVDPYAGLPQEVRTLLSKVPQLEAEVASASERSRRAEGRVHSLQGQLAKLSTPAPAPAPTEAPAQPLSKLQHAKDTLGTDMPEVMDALEELAALLPPQSAPPKPAAPAAAPTPSASQAPAAADIDPVAHAHFEALDTVRPDWFSTLDSADCKLWLTTRPDLAQTYQGMKTSGDALKVLGEFDRYRQNLKTAESTAATRASRMAAAVVPSGNTRAAPKPAPMSEEEAMRQGFNS